MKNEILMLVPGTSEFVNPKYVTHVEPSESGRGCRVYVVSHAGYGTTGIWTAVPAADVSRAINAWVVEAAS